MLVTLIGKPDCPLCDELKVDVLALQAELGFTLVERNIENDPEDWQRFRYLIPVLDIDGGPALTPPHTWALVRQALLDSRQRDPGQG